MHRAFAVGWILLVVAWFWLAPRWEIAGPELLDPARWWIDGDADVSSSHLVVRQGRVRQEVRTPETGHVALSAEIEVAERSAGRFFVVQSSGGDRWALQWTQVVGSGTVVLSPLIDHVGVTAQLLDGPGPLLVRNPSLKAASEHPTFRIGRIALLFSLLPLVVSVTWQALRGPTRRRAAVCLVWACLIAVSSLAPRGLRTWEPAPIPATSEIVTSAPHPQDPGFVKIDIPGESVRHPLAYLVLVLLLLRARPGLTAAVFDATLFGLAVEAAQLFTPDRAPDGTDVLGNTAGILLGAVAYRGLLTSTKAVRSS